LQGAAAAFGDGGVHHDLQPVLRDDVVRAKFGDPVGQRTGARQQGVDLGQDGIVAGQGLQLGPNAEQGLGLVGEAQLFP
jgi:hypothetical protein